MGLLSRKYFDVGGYFTSGSNWLQPRPPLIPTQTEDPLSL